MQLIDVLYELFSDRQRLLVGIAGSLARDHEEHVAIPKAIESGDETLAASRMQKHLQGVHDAVRRWDRHMPPSRQRDYTLGTLRPVR